LAETLTRGKAAPPRTSQGELVEAFQAYRQGMPVPALSAALHTITPGCHAVYVTAPRVQNAYEGTYVSWSDCYQP
jgi:hypothetical protein